MRSLVYQEDIILFQEKLLAWFLENGRDFPWRKKSASKYEMIIAEVFLQRTKAETVANFLPTFLKKFPTWNSLAESSEEEIQNSLRPIGLFNQRGTRLYKLTQEIKRRNGVFPEERSDVMELPMMGQYLTNAFELYFLKKKSPLLDVNMARILERFFGKRKLSDIRYDPFLQTLAYRVINFHNPIELNWAILDYASKICIKNKPKCKLCIIRDRCQYFLNQLRG